MKGFKNTTFLPLVSWNSEETIHKNSEHENAGKKTKAEIPYSLLLDSLSLSQPCLSREREREKKMADHYSYQSLGERKFTPTCWLG